MEIISKIKNKIEDIEIYFKEDFKYDFHNFLRNFPPGKWWFRYRFIPKYRYNLVRLPLPPNYYENDTRLFYSIFAIFEEHVNEAKEFIGGYDYIVGNDPDYDKYLANRDDIDECTLQYYKINREIYEDFYKAWHWWDEKGRNIEDDYFWKECYDEESKEYNYEKEEELREEQRQMMLKVVNHWRSLWC